MKRSHPPLPHHKSDRNSTYPDECVKRNLLALLPLKDLKAFEPLRRATLHGIVSQSLNVSGLLDTGSSVNVLPYDMGLRLGANWERQRLSVPLGGNLARFEARALVLTATIERFPPVALAFAWTRDRNAPLILGHMNFFLVFNVCFYRSELAFEISPKRVE